MREVISQLSLSASTFSSDASPPLRHSVVTSGGKGYDTPVGLVQAGGVIAEAQS